VEEKVWGGESTKVERWAAECEGGDRARALRFFIGNEERNAGFF